MRDILQKDFWVKSTRPAVSCDMATEVEVVKMWKSLSMESLLHCLLLAAVGEGFPWRSAKLPSDDL